MTQHPQPSAEALRTKIREAIVSVLEDAYDEGQEISELTYAIDRDADKIVNAGMAALAAPGEVVPDNIQDAYRKGWMDREADLLTGIERVYGATPAPGEMVDVQGALRDSAYIAGLKRGWNLGVSEDRTGFEATMRAYEGYLAPITAKRRAGATATPAPGGGVTIEHAMSAAWTVFGGNQMPAATWHEFAERLRTELRAHPPGGAQSGAWTWKPIETAPQSKITPVEGGTLVRGRYLLTYCPEEGADPLSCYFVAWWDNVSLNDKPIWGWMSENGPVNPTLWLFEMSDLPPVPDATPPAAAEVQR